MLTVEQFEQLPETEGVSFELDEGELIELSGPILRHERIQKRILLLIEGFLSSRRKLGEVMAEQEFRLSATTVRRPDVAFVGSENLSRLDQNRWLHMFAPDLVIEIASPSDTLNSLSRKTKQYLNAGTKAVWLVVPEMREVHIHSADARPRILTADENLEEPALLPGFSIRISSLFD